MSKIAQNEGKSTLNKHNISILGALDVCCIKVPPERKMYEYFIVCGARTDNHIQSIPQALSELHQQECGFKCTIEGANGLDGWSCAGKLKFRF